MHVFDRFIYIVCGTKVVFTGQFRKVRQIVKRTHCHILLLSTDFYSIIM